MEPHLELESGSGLRPRSAPFLQDQTQATRLHLVLRGGPRSQAEAATKLQEGIKERKQGSETLMLRASLHSVRGKVLHQRGQQPEERAGEPKKALKSAHFRSSKRKRKE